MAKKEYWQRRFLSVKANEIKNTEEYERALQPELNGLYQDINKELYGWYNRYAGNQGVSILEAEKMLKEINTKDWELTLKQFEEKAKAGGYQAELDSEYFKSRVARLQNLKAQLEQTTSQFANKQVNSMRNQLTSQYQDSYMRETYHLQAAHMDFTSNFSRFSEEQLRMVVSKPWGKDGKDFSARIWKNYRDLLPNYLMNAALKGTILGTSASKIARDMQGIFEGVKKNQIHRLVNSELGHIQEEATAKAYQEDGIEQYEYLATLESKTCSVCGNLDGLKFKLKDRKDGVNYPLIHAWCRCTTVPFIDDLPDIKGRWMRDPKTGKGEIVENISYNNWKSMVSGNVKPIISKKIDTFDPLDMAKWPEKGIHVMNTENGPEVSILSAGGKPLAKLALDEIKQMSESELIYIQDMAFKRGFSDKQRSEIRNWFNQINGNSIKIQQVTTNPKTQNNTIKKNVVNNATSNKIQAPVINNVDDFSSFLKKSLGYKEVAIHPLDTKVLQSFADSMAKVYTDYPELNGWVDSFTSTTKKTNYKALASMKSNGTAFANHLEINANEFNDYDKVMDALNKQVKDGYTTKKTTPGGLIVHELGHIADRRAKAVKSGINQKSGLDFDKGWNYYQNASIASDIANMAYEKFGRTKMQSMPKYAKTKDVELIAEAFSDESDNEISAWIRDELKRRLKK